MLVNSVRLVLRQYWETQSHSQFLILLLLQSFQPLCLKILWAIAGGAALEMEPLEVGSTTSLLQREVSLTYTSCGSEDKCLQCSEGLCWASNGAVEGSPSRSWLQKSWYLLGFQHQDWLPLAESVSSSIREPLVTTKVDMVLLHP